MSLTAPFDPAWSSRLGGVLTMLTDVTVTGSGISPVRLDVINGTVSWNEENTPHVEANLTCRVPEDQAFLDALDARLNRRLVVTGGYRVPGVSETHTLADLMLAERVVRRSASGATMTVRAYSDDMRLIEYENPVTGSRTYYEGTDGGQAIANLIRWAVPTAVIEVSASGTFVAAGETLLIDREDNLWSAVQDIADRIGAWVYHDGLGTFRVVPQPVNAASASAMLGVGTGGTITDSESILGRTDFANTVAVVHEWYDGESQSAYGYAEVTSGPYAVSAIGRKTKRVVIDRKGTTAQAQASAASMLARAVTRGRALSVEYEHAPLWVRPGQTATVSLPTGPQERHLVSRVDLDIPSGRGHITTRMPENVVITTGE